MTERFWRTVRRLHSLVGQNPPLFDPEDRGVPVLLFPYRPVVHFVGFRGDEFSRAVRVFGRPDFVHRHNDPRFRFGGELADGDTVVFANGSESRPSKFSFNDSDVGLT